MNTAILYRTVDTISLCLNWAVLILSKVVSKPLKWTLVPVKGIRLRNGLTFALRNSELDTDLAILGEVWCREEYTPPFMAIGSGDVVVDVGANKGYFAVYASQRASEGKVYAFEPVPRLFSLLEQNVDRNRITNIVCFQRAVSQSTGTAQFLESLNNNNSHSLYAVSGESRAITVQTTTIKDFCAEQNIRIINF